MSSNQQPTQKPHPVTRLTGPVLVTGATGFIGQRVVARLLDEGVAVRALVLPDEAPPNAWRQRVQVVFGSITDADAVNAAVQGVCHIVHLAAMVGDWGAESLHQAVTVDGTRHLFEAASAQQVPVVLVSSIVVYGNGIRHAVCDETQPHGTPLGPYSRAKQAQERMVAAFREEHGLRCSTVRPGNVYGPGSRPWVHSLIDEIRRGSPLLIDGGRFNAGLAHVDNVVDVILRATDPAAEGEAFNALDGSDVTWRQYVSDLADMVGVTRVRSLPRWLAVPMAEAMERGWHKLNIEARPPLTREALNLVGSDHQVPISKARERLGYEPQISYRQGIDALWPYVESLNA